MKKIIGFSAALVVLILLVTWNYNQDKSDAVLGVEQELITNSRTPITNKQVPLGPGKTEAETFSKNQAPVKSHSAESSDLECYVLSELEQQERNDTIDSFKAEHVLFSNSVLQHMTELGEDELVAEYEAGNRSAAFVLGMNYYYSSNHTTWFHPHLRKSFYVENNKPAEFDIQALEKGRKWLKTAAVEGLGIALSYLGYTYELERQFVEIEFNAGKLEMTAEEFTDVNLALKAKGLAYRLIATRVMPSLVEIYGEEVKMIDVEEFEQLEHPMKSDIYDDIYEAWTHDRSQFNEPPQIEIGIPPQVQSALVELKHICKN